MATRHQPPELQLHATVLLQQCLDNSGFYVPHIPGEEHCGSPSPLAVSKGWLAVGSVYLKLIADPGCWWSEEPAVFTQCLCFNGSPCTFKGTNTD